jgi:thiol-disulfide isomerase/thioredoxin
MRSALPSFEGAERWINVDAPPSSETLAGKPVLVHFWSISCYICHDVAERLALWREKYAPMGLEIVAVHQPRSPEELDVEKVIADARDAMRILQPMAIDNEHAIVERFENQFVPAYYLFDRQHRLRHFQAGDKGYDRIESAIERALTEDSKAIREEAPA